MREHLVLVGTSFRRIGFERLGRYVLPVETAEELAGLEARLGATELVYIATCNRVEVYLIRPGPYGPDGLPLDTAELPARAAELFASRGVPAAAEDLFVLTGEAALAHLFGVVASLDSLVLGECEIAGQVRRAAEAAQAKGLAGPSLRRIFDQAARVAKRVRSETAIGRTPVSVASLVVRRVREHFKAAPARRAVLLGVGDMTKKVAQALEGSETRLLFVNRTESRAAALADRYGGEALSLERFRADPPADVDLVVSATRAPAPVVDAAVLGRALAVPRAERLLVCDLGVPADVDPAVAAHPAVRLLKLEDLEATAQENRRRLSGEIERVRAIVAEEVRRFATEARLRALAAESAEAILAGRLSHLAPADRETVRRFATHLAERMARQPGPAPAMPRAAQDLVS